MQPFLSTIEKILFFLPESLAYFVYILAPMLDSSNSTSQNVSLKYVESRVVCSTSVLAGLAREIES